MHERKEDAERILRFREQKENLLSPNEEILIGETCNIYTRKNNRGDLEELDKLVPAKRRMQEPPKYKEMVKENS